MNEEKTDTLSELEVLQPSAVESMLRGEIDIQIATAHKYPRSIATFKKRALEMVALDEDTAASCIYSRPVGKENGVMKYAEGMSVRLAEIVGACYGNLRVGSQVVDMTPRHVTARGFAHDLESNFANSSEVVEATVDKLGHPYSERMRLVTAKAALAKARRDATFVVVPKALCKPLEDEARRIAIGDATTLAKRRAAVMAWIGKLGIDVQRVFAALGIKGEEDIGIDQLTTLTGLKTSIKDGEVTVDEAFPISQEATARAGKPDWDKIDKEKEIQPLPPVRRGRQRLAPTSAVKTESAEATPPTKKEVLHNEFPDDESRAAFLEGLRKIQYLGLEMAETISEIPEETCAKILNEGVEKIWAKVNFDPQLDQEAEKEFRELFPPEEKLQQPPD